jgi:hypothetical protein
MIEHINDFVARHGRGVGTSAGSFARVGLWTVLFLALISFVLPSQQLTLAQVNGPKGKALAGARGNPRPRFETFGVRRLRPGDPVQNIQSSLDDQRAFVKSPFPKRRFRIAWIAGSEGEIYGRPSSEYLPSSVISHIPEIAGRKPAVDVYFLLDIHIADVYFALLDALETKPDMIVVSLNPVYALNPVAVHQWMQLDSNAARQLLAKPASWPIGAELLAPSDLMWGLGSAAFRPIRDRWYYDARVHSAFDDFGPLDRSDLVTARAQAKPDRYQTTLNAQPSIFFSTHRVGSASADKAEYWARWLALERDGENALNKTILRAIARQLREANIPSYVYLAQVNSAFLAHKSFDRALGNVERQLGDLRHDFASPKILYQSRSISRFLGPAAFREGDPVHLRQSGPVGPYLAGQLCHLAAQVGVRATCT